MIIVKTKLKKIPDTCKTCKYVRSDMQYGCIYKVCGLTGSTCKMEQTGNRGNNWAYIRNKDCPLVEMEVTD